MLRRVAENHRAEVARARDAYLGETDSDEVTRDTLISYLHADRAVILDVRPAEEYRAGHIPGAISIPLEELAERISELRSDIDVVVYCRGEYCVLAYDAVRLLTQEGHRAVRLQDGMLEWRLANLPVTVEISA